MGAFTDKLKGMFNQRMGRARQSYGYHGRNDSTTTRGMGQELKGTGQSTMGDVKETVGNVARDVGSKIKRS